MSGDEGYGPDGGFGWSGSDTSRERAEDVDTMRRREQGVYECVRMMGATGRTSGEVEAFTGLGHGAASAALSKLHKDGYLTRLTERRGGRAQVYVHPDYVNGREEAPFRPNRANRDDYVPTPLATDIHKVDVVRAMGQENLSLLDVPKVLAVLGRLGIEVKGR